MTISTFLEELDRVIPIASGMAGDPLGLQVGDRTRVIENVAVAYEVDERIVREAAERSAGLIVTYHPLIYAPLTRLVGVGRIDRSVQELIRRDVALHILHTALDVHPRGGSARLAEELGLREITTLDGEGDAATSSGIGRIGTLPEPMSVIQFVDRVTNVCGSRSVRYSINGSRSGETKVQRIALVVGSGMSLYSTARASGADLFLTGDAKYHDFHAANDAIPIVDAGHAETERYVVECMTELVSEALHRLGSTVGVVPIATSVGPIGYAA